MGRCRRHPHHVVVGICAYCLNDHLSALLEAVEDSEDPIIHFPSRYLSPVTLASSNPSSGPGCTVPETPASALRRSPFPFQPLDDSIPSRASSSQFSIHFSPQHQRESHYNTCSSSFSPQNQVLFGNPHFIKGEIPRKNKSPFWSFLQRRKDSYFDACSTARWHHDHGLEDIVTNYHTYSDDGSQASALQMHLHREKRQSDRHGRWKLSSSSMREFQARGSHTGKERSLPHTALSCRQAAAHNHKLSPSKQECYHYIPSSAKQQAIRRSPLRPESHDGDDECFSEGIHSTHSCDPHNIRCFAQGSQIRDGNRKSRRHGSSSSWISSLFQQKIRRSTISGIDELGVPDMEATSAQSVSLADHVYGSPRCIPMKASRSKKTDKGDKHHTQSIHINVQGHSKSLHSQSMHIHGQGQSKRPKGSSFRGYFGKGSSAEAAKAAPRADHAHSPTDFSRFEAHAQSCQPPPSKPIMSSLSAAKRSSKVSMDCGKEYNRVSPMIKMPDSKSPHSPLTDESVSPLHLNHVQKPYRHVNGAVPRCSPNFECLEHGSTMQLSDDEFRRSPTIIARSAGNVDEHTQSPCRLAPVKTRSSEAPDEHVYGNHDSYTGSARRWSKAFRRTLAPMLGIGGRGKKQGARSEGAALSESQLHHHVQQCVDETHGFEACKPSPPPPHHDDDAYIDFHHHPLYHHGLHQQAPPESDIKAGSELHSKQSFVLPGLDIKGPPQQYSFLSRDYSAFSFYFNPNQAYDNAEEASYSAHKPVQAGTGELCPWKPHSLSSRAADCITAAQSRR